MLNSENVSGDNTNIGESTVVPTMATPNVVHKPLLSLLNIERSPRNSMGQILSDGNKRCCSKHTCVKTSWIWMKKRLTVLLWQRWRHRNIQTFSTRTTYWMVWKIHYTTCIVMLLLPRNSVILWTKNTRQRMPEPRSLW